jgi:hypothetical protein
MLPFLKQKQEGSASSPVESVKREPDEDGQEYDSLESAVADLFDAYKSMDNKAGAAALRAAFDILENQPHEESDHG